MWSSTTSALLFLCFWLSLAHSGDIYSCPRTRKAWHLSTDDERSLFINAMHKLNAEGKIAHFGSAHHNELDQTQAHGTSEFFAWHRYLLWEFENQVRRLGPEYECFSVPYWDVTTDTGLFTDAFVFKSGIGGPGEPDHDECVNAENDGAWSREDFPLPHVCHELESAADNPTNGCCLKRAAGRTSLDLSGVSGYTNFIKKYPNFGADIGFRSWTFNGKHGEVHSFVGGGFDSYTHMISRYASEDPLFYMLHSWLDYVYVVWKQCWGYNKIAPEDLDQHPSAYFEYPIASKKMGVPSSGLDDALLYLPMHDLPWWEGKKRMPTARKLYDEQAWNMQYERGTFLPKSKLSIVCDNQEDGWDSNVLVPNSEETKAIIEALRSHGDEGSEVDVYQQRVWTEIERLKTLASFADYDDADWLQTWHAKTCNFQRQRRNAMPCYVPVDYEKCTDDDQVRGDAITLEELLQKDGVHGNTCLEEVRGNLYAWAKQSGLVYELCAGRFDDYHVCPLPVIDFMIDEDDAHYYDALLAMKEKMRSEDLALHADENNLVMAKSNVVSAPLIGEIADLIYPMYHSIVSTMIVLVMLGVAIFTMLRYCCRCQSDLSHPSDPTQENECNTDMFGYGSMAEML
eukprot:CAMPEP_0202697796 /NCGR_PEP_ID=MMETSP1385-20130828/11103_1 /ASSEMBLY_ACC=CAM_ASM_000861 /TAXON_ID=933848 /ORGANISM="Elphidium margaritaceum" /LENGTH=625 /DNA_ID=CAMNT_0049354343 /DNA_START=41 /DNA_END=1918 /DNA_ORIENTATION=-